MPEPIPSKVEIDTLALMYNEAREARKAAEEREDLFKGQLSEMVASFGFLPPRATKSKRLLGSIWQITVSASSSVEIDGTEVLRFRDLLKLEKLGRIFGKLFRREVVYVLRSDAHETAAQYLVPTEDSKIDEDDLRRLYAAFKDCLSVKGKGETLDVVPIKKEKKEKKSA